MALTEKGQNALAKVKEFFPKGQFSAKDLSDACGEKIMAATLNGVANNGYILKLGGTPVMYEAIDNLEEIYNEEMTKPKGCDNSNLTTAKRVKNDEFYTRYEDIEAEVMKYRKQFVDKIVYLPCDDPAEKKSEFWSFFVNNFDAFGLKKLIATHYDENGKAYKIWLEDDVNNDGYIDDEDAMQEDLEGNGDFRSPECVNILEECDIVVTNPPFSLFKEFLPLIAKYNKNFLIIGPLNATTYKEVFPLIKSGKMWSGYNNIKEFMTPDGGIQKFGNVFWYTNMPNKNTTDFLILTKEYNNVDYPKCDYYNAIYIDKVVNIPKDYKGCMAVPISIFQGKYNPNQFEIIGNTESKDFVPEGYHNNEDPCGCVVGGVAKYKRLFIRNKSL